MFKATFDERNNERFPDLKCAVCGMKMPLGTALLVQTDVSGWLLYAKHAVPNECVSPVSSAE